MGNRCGGGPTARSNEENTNENSNPYSNAQYPPPPPGFFGGRRHHPPPHHRNPWTRNNHCGGKRGHGRRGGRNRCPWRKGCKGGRWAREQQQNNNNNNAANMPQQNNVDESPVATFGKMMSNALNATGGQAMKWVGEMCENPSDKKFSTDLQKAINQSLKETQPVYQQKPPVVNDTSSSENLNKNQQQPLSLIQMQFVQGLNLLNSLQLLLRMGKGKQMHGQKGYMPKVLVAMTSSFKQDNGTHLQLSN